VVSGANPGVRIDGKETAARVVKAARAELNRHGAVNFSLDRVISASKVSRSSIYHLFGNRAGLIAHAEAQAIVEDVSDGAYLLRNLAEKVESPEQLRFLIEQWLKDAMTPSRVKQRARRIANIAVSESDTALREVLHAHLHEVSGVWVETYEILRRRGIVMVPSVDLRALALAVQGVYLGGILVDLFDDAEVADHWTNVVAEMLARFFGVSRKGTTDMH
jgi:AcrR family transcriptional regulator